MRRSHWLVALACIAGTAWSASPTPQQFAQGMEAMPQESKPLVQVALPDEVYRTVTSADLADLAVFDANGNAVPHALCAAPESGAPTVGVVELPVIELRAAESARSSGTQVDVQTSSGTHVAVRDGAAIPNAAVSTQAHVIDATSVELSLRSIEFDWQTADGSSEAQVRIDASDDLDRWRAVVATTRLLQAGTNGRELRRERVSLPQQPYRYLRVERIDGGTPITIRTVHAETVSDAPSIEPQWFTPLSVNVTANTRVFASDHRAPIQYARLTLPFDNMTVRATLQSRPNEKAAWITRWSGEMYAVTTNGERKASAPARFAATSDREWRLQFAADTATAVGLELGYRPALLRFVAQGNRPFTIAYGSRQVDTPAVRGCDELLGDMNPETRRALIGDAELRPPRVLGGEAAFKPLPKKTPVRLMVLWGVLVVGVALLVTMALSLLKRVKRPE